MVSQFPSDYMHMVCLGVTRLLILMWIKGPLKTSLGTSVIQTIYESLLALIKYTPCEFNRKPRSLNDVKFWKATEFRCFLLYTGPIVLQHIPKPMFDNFMMLSVSIKILVSKLHHINLNDVAGNILSHFVQHCADLYGREFVVYNVHSLYHLHLDCKMYGPLDLFSAWPFENYLGTLKSLVRSSKQPLQQIQRRVYELGQKTDGKSLRNSCKLGNFNGEIVPEFCGDKYLSLELNGFKFYVKQAADSYCMLLNDFIVKIDCFLHNDEDIYVIGREFTVYGDYFVYHKKSSLLDIFKISALSNSKKKWHVDEVKTKCVVYPFRNNLISFPLE